jgi:hypothetical protein
MELEQFDRLEDKFDGAVNSALGERSQKLSNFVGHRMGDHKFTISSSSVLRQACLAISPGCICSP